MERGLWLQATDGPQLSRVPYARAAAFARLAPDGKRVWYIDLEARSLKVVGLDGGEPQTVRDSMAEEAFDLTPGGDAVIYRQGSLVRVPEAGGADVRLSVRDTSSGELNHVMPDVLPNGRGILFTIRRYPTSDLSLYNIAVLDIATGKHRVLGDGVAARYVDGYLLVVSPSGMLTAAPFDPNAFVVTGDVRTLAADVRVTFVGNTDLASNAAGAVAYRAGGGDNSNAEIIWVDRNGAVWPFDDTWKANFRSLAISPDGSQVAVGLAEGPRQEVWIHRGASRSRLNLEGRRFARPRWFDGGQKLMMIANDSTMIGARVDGVSALDTLFRHDSFIFDGFVTPDNSAVVARTSKQQADILVRRRGDSLNRPLLVTKDDERFPALSPDGRWLAYRSSETGVGDVFVRPFANIDGGKWRVSRDGGQNPVWSRSGRELFYIRNGNELWSTRVANSTTFSFSSPERLFAVPTGVRGLTPYDVSPDDSRFLMIRNIEPTLGWRGQAPIVVITSVREAYRRAASGVPKTR
jgi:serine/threonine-protein kinase